MHAARRAAAAALAAVASTSSRGPARSLATAPFHLTPGPFLKRDLGEFVLKRGGTETRARGVPHSLQFRPLSTPLSPPSDNPAHTALLLDGTAAAAAWTAELAVAAAAVCAARGGRPPGLAVVLVGDRPDSALYALRKREACARAGVAATLIHLPSSSSQDAVDGAVAAAGRDPAIDGVLLQLPLPPHLDPGAALAAIPPAKDVDGALPAGLGTLLARGGSGEPQAWGSPEGLVPSPSPAGPPPPFFTPCTALGAAALLARAGLWGPSALGGATAVLVGDSPTVGLPLAALLRGAGVGSTTLVHRPATAPLFERGGGGGVAADDARVAAGACLPSPVAAGGGGGGGRAAPPAPPPSDAVASSARAALAAKVATADILVAAVGAAGAIPGHWLKPGCLVLDVGINVLPGGEDGGGGPGGGGGGSGGYRVVGDVDAAGAGRVAAAITPVPGGLGPMTIAALLHNTVAAAAGSVGVGAAVVAPPAVAA